MFDKTSISVSSGKGGDGIVSFRREKFVPFGGPDGGDGGKGGDVIIEVEPNETSLKKYYLKKQYRAQDGANGAGRKRRGKDGKTITLTVPPGTVITRIDGPEPELLADMNEPSQKLLVARGGKGGKGNIHFSSSTNQAPRLASLGEPGKQKTILLEMKLIADIGIIGLPNAGKSSLLAASSAARPRIADYAFTTLEPELGVVERGRCHFVMADIPGLVTGASEGRGLGHEFLRHIVRTRLLVHLVNGESETPLEDFMLVNRELELYDRSLAFKKQLVAVSKLDLDVVRERKENIRLIFAREGIHVDFISSLSGEGLDCLLAKLSEALARARPQALEPLEEEPVKTFRPGPKAGISVTFEGGYFTLEDESLERIVAGSDTHDAEVRRQIWRLIEKKGGVKLLEKSGIKPGDSIRIGDFEWRW